MAVYRIQFQMVDTFEIETDLADNAKEAVKIIRESLENGDTFVEQREFISWDIGTVRVVEKLS